MGGTSSDRTAHTARMAPGHRQAWEVTWLPGWYMSRNTAITAMTLAETVAAAGPHPGQQLWPHIEAWAAELGLTAAEAVTRATEPAPPKRQDSAPQGLLMTGPEHYAAAEEILSRPSRNDPDSPVTLANLTIGQIHATLALAAASAVGDRDFRSWLEVAGPPSARS
jgi:hypothetical protein